MGTDKKIHHAISLARDAIYTSSLKKGGYAICDLDFKSAFDLLGMNWVFRVLECKGLNAMNVNRLRRYYTDSSTIPIINNIQGRRIDNKRLTLRQGDARLLSGSDTAWIHYCTI